MKVLILAFCVCIALATNVEDPLCVLEGCPSNKPCRVVTECLTPGVCSLRALCMDNLPQWSHTGVCQIGQPILTMRDGAWGDTYCGPSLPCPNTTYCNTELMDTYATCCRSDPANTVKPGNCPAITNNDTSYCSDECNNDGDCRNDYKCCSLGCRRSCIPPEVKDTSCQTKECPKGTYCLTKEMPSCTTPDACYNVGDCVPCGPRCKRACPGDFEKDARGCPKCLCKPPPPSSKRRQTELQQTLYQTFQQTAPQTPQQTLQRTAYNRLLWMLLMNNQLF
ncbi:hypothetical protein BsWGS_05775 [Bradybaena similaris]